MGTVFARLITTVFASLIATVFARLITPVFTSVIAAAVGGRFGPLPFSPHPLRRGDDPT